MLKILLMLSLAWSSSLMAVEWISADKICSFSVPEKWVLEPSEEKFVEAQFRGPDQIKSINVSVVPIPKNFHVGKKGIIDGIAKQGGSLVSYDDMPDQGIPTVKVAWDFQDGNGHVLVIMKYDDKNLYKWQAFSDVKVADDAAVQGAAKSFKLAK